MGVIINMDTQEALLIGFSLALSSFCLGHSRTTRITLGGNGGWHFLPFSCQLTLAFHYMWDPSPCSCLSLFNEVRYSRALGEAWS